MTLPLQIESPFQIQLSFFEVIEEFEKVAADPANPRSVEAAALLHEVNQHPELRDGLKTIEQIEANAGLIHRLLADFFPEHLSNNEIKAVGLPYRKAIFNFSERFKKILNDAGPDFDIGIRDLDEHQSYVLSCCIILNEYYGTRLDFSKPMFYDIPAANGIMKHYRILYNAEYLHIIPTERSVKLTQADIDQLLDNYDNIDLWREKFPKESWLLRGFSIMNLFDATVENAISLLKEKLLSANTVDFKHSVESIFRSIYQIPDLRVGFMVFNNEEKVFHAGIFASPVKSFILNGKSMSADDNICLDFYKELVHEQTYFAVSDVKEYTALNDQSGLASHLLEQDVRSIILTPVIKGGVLLGVLEVVSSRPKELNSVNARKLEAVMPFLTDSVERMTSELQNQIQAIIQNNYTTIHPSVYWRFKEEARSFIRAQREGGNYALKEVIFKDVYPLYGQIDIKGSSEARNTSVQNDLQYQLDTLMATLYKVETRLNISFDEERRQIEEFNAQLKLPIQASTEQHITDYLTSVVHHKLLQVKDPALKPGIDAYFAETNKISGDFYIYRRKFETTVALINEKLVHYLDASELEAQNIFSHYYERFKTDGVEHNLYIGASISPEREFMPQHLHQLRLWQLNVLCRMEKAHHDLKSRLPFAFDVTTLILAYHSSISIRFRMDEKRFDVDGTYNARFEIVKKRIDKAHIKDTEERITQAGKITIVYSNDSEAQEYRTYIADLQAKGMLDSVIEDFELEDLQGVVGLRALRVKITH